MVEIKDENFKNMVPFMPNQKSSWIMGSRIYGEERTQISLSSPATIAPLTRFRIDRVHTDKKIANNIKINHMMVSLTDHLY